MNVLVIGSKGFLGKHIHNYFNGLQDYETWACDVVVDYAAPRYIQVDATNSDFTEIFAKNSFELCINCSGAASVPDSLVNPHRDFLLNTYNVFRMLDAIRKQSPSCKFINMSSAAVYGNPSQLPVKESDRLMPISPYGQHKLMAEKICREFVEFYGLKTCSLRIFSAYGEGLKKQILWDIFNKTKKDNSLQLYGTGAETRDFIHISDITRAVHLLSKQAAFDGEAINVANGCEVSINELVSLFTELSGWRGQIKFNGLRRAGDPVNWRADTSQINSYGYIPLVPLKDGLTRYIKWANENA